ncbi:MAG: enoyl-CoA hydratase [Clostridiaceae bacterium]|jgi:enoyl-CoA hydratase|nr:enoyl-CoA hydratase [Clostridiaceae bacterium]
MEFVKVDVKDAVATITIDRPKALNALNTQVLKDIAAAFDSLDLDEVRCVILTGSGDRSFVAGADIGEMVEMDSAAGKELGRVGNKVMRDIENFPIPVIAAINGFALGGGNELAMSCDVRLASDNAIFGQPEVGLGITPGFGGTQRLARVIGNLSKAKELLYTGRNIKADQALELGLVSAVYPQEELIPAAEKMASIIAANAPVAVRNTKAAVNRGLQTDIDAAIEIEVELFGELFDTADQKEGMNAFLEKRKEKNFQNR